MSKTTKEATKENKNDIEDGHQMSSTWFDHDNIHFRPCCRAAKSLLHNPTKMNCPMKLGSSLY